jgi:hypothetical protein
MTTIIPKLKKTGPWLACIAAVVMVIAGVIFLQTPNLPAFSNDDAFTQAVNNISNFVPRNETLLVTTRSTIPVIKYFTGHPTTKIPSKVNSYESLVQYMSQNNFTYLVIPKISSNQVESLKPLFTTQGIKELKKDFLKIGDFKTKYSRIFLYKKIGGS